MRQGRCTNFGNCSIADKAQTIPGPPGTDFQCPECGRGLTEVGNQGSGPKVNVGLIGGAVVGLAVVVSAAVLAMRGSTTKNVSVLTSQRTILRLSGSNTIGDSLVPSLVEAFLKDQGATDVHVIPGAKADEKIVIGRLPGDSEPSSVSIAAHGSATAFTDLAAGKADVGMASRPVKMAEAASLASMGDMTAASNEHVLGLDGIAVIVSPSNPVSSLSKDQLRCIFSGACHDWPSVGGSEGAINLYARDDKSGTYDTFKALVLGDKTLLGSAKRFEDSGTLSDAVAGDPHGIGFIGLPYIRSAKALSVYENGTRPMQPTQLTVQTEAYVLHRRLFLYTPAAPINPWTNKLIRFAISTKGQDVVGAEGFVSQNPNFVAYTPPAEAPAEYKQLTADAERLNLDFRFRTGSAELDNKAVADLARTAAVIAALHYSGNRIMVFGFADSRGTASKNKELSFNRASFIQNQFDEKGIRPEIVRGFGSDMPVASNDTEDGRTSNRRVEIWVKK